MSTLVQHKQNETNANQNTVQVTVASTGAGALIAVAAANNGGMTVTGVADDKLNLYSQISGAQSDRDGGAGGKGDIWRCLSATAGVTSVTITFSATDTSFKAGWVWEGSMASAAEDGAAVVNAQTSSANTSNGASLNTTSTDGFVVGLIVTGGGVTANPKAGNEFTAGGDIGATSLWAGCSLISTTAAAHQPVWSDSSGVLFCASTAAFKSAGGVSLDSKPAIRGGRGVDLGPSGRRMMPQQFPVPLPPDTTASPAAPFMVSRGRAMGPPKRRMFPQRFSDTPAAAPSGITYPQLEHAIVRGAFRGIRLGVK